MCHRDEFLTEDVQSAMTLQVLGVAERLVDCKATPRSIVNYLVKTVQNRLRNYVRDTEKKKNLMLPLDSAGDLFSTAIDGRRLPLVSGGKKKDRKAD